MRGISPGFSIHRFAGNINSIINIIVTNNETPGVGMD